jgi:hypothetical protein
MMNNACEYIRFAGSKAIATYTNPMTNSPYWATNISPGSQEILCISRTQKFISAFTRVRHLSPILSQIHALPSYLRYNLILSSKLCLGLSSGLFHSGFFTKILHHTIKYLLNIKGKWYLQRHINSTSFCNSIVQLLDTAFHVWFF